MSDYVRLLYRSIAKFPDFDPSDLAILRSALRFNLPHGITGFLWRANGQFFQALHGRAEALDDLMARIARDDRHTGVEVLVLEPTEAPSPFPDWSMGYDHFLAAELGIELAADGTRPAITPDSASHIFEAIVKAAHAVREFGSAFPYARVPGEEEDAYLKRLEEVC